MKYAGACPLEDISADDSYIKFYLKNLAPIVGKKGGSYEKRDYELIVDFKKSPRKVLKGSYDKEGLPYEWKDIIFLLAVGGAIPGGRNIPAVLSPPNREWAKAPPPSILPCNKVRKANMIVPVHQVHLVQ